MTSCLKDKNIEALSNYIVRFDEIVRRLFEYQRPVACAIEGHAIAGGTCIAACCDFRYSNGKGVIVSGFIFYSRNIWNERS